MTSLLGEFHNRVTMATGAAEDSRRFSEDAGHQYDTATEVAIDLLQSSGYSHDDKDTLGNEIGDVAQTLLTLAFHLAPNLVPQVQILLDKD